MSVDPDGDRNCKFAEALPTAPLPARSNGSCAVCVLGSGVTSVIAWPIASKERIERIDILLVTDILIPLEVRTLFTTLPTQA